MTYNETNTKFSRRRFLQLSAASLAVTLALPGKAIGAVKKRRPNVILIYTDDQGAVDINRYGATDLLTPHMDALCDEGIRFTQFYAPSSVCSPSRAGLLTGRYPLRTGMLGNGPSLRGNAGMSTKLVTIAEMMKEAEYRTAHIGKWHLGYSTETMPNAQGFDHSFGHMGGCIDNYSHSFYSYGPNFHDLHRDGKEVYEDGRYFPDLMVEEAERFMESQGDHPFFMYFAMNSPHYPVQGDAKWIAYYQKQGTPYPRDLYAAFVSSQDERIGQLVATVDRLGLREDTILIFQSDQGHDVSKNAHGGGGSAGPYRGAKKSLFEGGIRVPAMIRWPGHIPQGETRNQIAHACDWMATLAELCDVPLVNDDIDGKSLVDVIRNPDAPSPHDVLHWQMGETDGKGWAVRKGDWKLLGLPVDPTRKEPFAEEDQLFLVNLAEDIGEKKNLARDFPDKVRELEHLHMDWYQGALEEVTRNGYPIFEK
ncbi:MAG: sulfatase-like hydrolase/transferase [Candidatus Hydrogenedentes bacterium]|nr:sulfatase-like hydrolase/transferase [Candidatus Hydrogenedentota bacterium]